MCMRKIVILSAAMIVALGSGAVFAAGPNLGKPIVPGRSSPNGTSTSSRVARDCLRAAERRIRAPDISPNNAPPVMAKAARAQPPPPAARRRLRPVVSDMKRNGIDDTTLTIANYWPYATTLFDYIRRSMPWPSPRSLERQSGLRSDSLHSGAEQTDRSPNWWSTPRRCPRCKCPIGTALFLASPNGCRPDSSHGSMDHFAILDVSDKETSICFVDGGTTKLEDRDQIWLNFSLRSRSM